MDKAKLFEMLLATFVDELSEHVESLNTGVLNLESLSDESERQESLTVMFRAAHSLKGAARSVDALPIEAACHGLEDVLSGIRDGRVTMTPKIGSVILAVADAIATSGDILRAREPLAEEHFGGLPEQLQRIAAGESPGKVDTPTVKPEEPSESPAEAGAFNESPGSKDVISDDAPVASPQPVEPSEDIRRRVEVSTSEPFEPAVVETEKPTTEQKLAARRKGLGTTVRVAEGKLDSLMAQAGELLVARQRIEIRPDEIEAVAGLAADTRSEYQSIQRLLLALVEQNQNHPLMRRSSRITNQLTSIIDQTGERLKQLEIQLESFQQRLLVDSRQLNHTGESLQEDIHRIRMLPFGDGCAGLDRAVRDVAQATGKQVDFVIEGADIEVDRTVLEGLRDPLLHLVRNSIDHGLETPAERKAAGKPGSGRVQVSAVLRGSQVEIIVSDDGRGLNREAILKKRRKLGLAEPHNDQELFRSIFLPGFSTATQITDLSGRGVGMDVVRSKLESLHGTIDLSSQPGFGSRFTLSVPLTLTTISALFVRASGQIYALPSNNVSRLVRFQPCDVKSMNGQDVLSLGGPPIPVSSLVDVLAIQAANKTVVPAQLTAVVLTTGDRELAVIVDEVVNEREAVVKNLGPQIRRIRHVSGATLLRTGGIALLLNIATLVRSQTASGSTIAYLQQHAQAEQATAHRVLVVDDSITTRSLMKGILESAGYDVTAAVDGQDAWQRMQETSDFELVVSDVDMPNMNGFELTTRIRQSTDFEHLPIILVTSRDSDEDKALGAESGANAYLVKSSFHQTDVLDTIEQLL